ncbi:energy transducer TonB [Solimonas sp. K1W22B-7]|uniref:energy transducer TonB n=1 Tax=Solimonas sp. K1W22B-7 TaxID=2303331 RepID=UPI000E32E0D4|nr:energy transducer TonB [Solimonas sp. K1W22B-7]AXQ29754.1 energy transducer TonB [Solimonas sp. K1W22B-7]
MRLLPLLLLGFACAATAQGTLPPPVLPPATPPPVVNAPPLYPDSERIAGHEGRVMLDVQVLPDGGVSGLTISQSSGYPALDQAALDAVRQWRFRPARGPDGVPVPGRLRLPVDFRLPERPAPDSGSANVMAMLKQPCSKLTADVAAFRAGTPWRSLSDMPTFQATGGLLASAASGKSPEVLARLTQNLPTLYEQIATACLQQPEAVYENMVAEVTRRLMK